MSCKITGLYRDYKAGLKFCAGGLRRVGGKQQQNFSPARVDSKKRKGREQIYFRSLTDLGEAHYVRQAMKQCRTH